MITLKTISLTYNSPSESQQKSQQVRPDCYLIVETNSLTFYTKTVQCHLNIYQWQINQQQVKIPIKSKGGFLQFKLIQYDRCKQINNFEVDLNELSMSNCNKRCEQTIKSNTKGEVTISLEFGVTQEKEVRSQENIGVVSRNSKKTKTTNYEESFVSPNIQKVSSLKQIVNYAKKQCPISASGTPNLRQLAYLRSYRQNLQKKLYTSIQLQARTLKRYIV